jgi:hypothetical protein
LKNRCWAMRWWNVSARPAGPDRTGSLTKINAAAERV